MIPTLAIDLAKLQYNASLVAKWCADQGIHVFGVTKACLGDPSVARAMLAGGCRGLADSRWQNMRRLKAAGIEAPLMLIRTPGVSEAEEVVQFADISLNTEAVVLEALSAAAARQSRWHKVVLMLETGDRREGKSAEEILHLAHLIHELPNLEFLGIGTNLGCWLGGRPGWAENNRLEKALGLWEEATNSGFVVSGGSSSMLPLVIDGSVAQCINQLRIGEAILLGKDPVTGDNYQALSQSAFVLRVEVVETGWKAGCDANPSLQALAAIGTQDIGKGRLRSLTGVVEMVGSTSDHLVLNVVGGSSAETPMESPQLQQAAVSVGSVLEFVPDYEALVGLMTSPYIEKVYRLSHQILEHTNRVRHKRTEG